jgi:SNF2 family DNA or RNA helicase
MGKSHEAMLVISQKWLEGQSRILLVIPNADLLRQWTELIDRYYTIPYVVLASRKEWNDLISDDTPNAFEQSAIVMTTYDFAADNEAAVSAVRWDLTVFEEANALSSVYQEDNKQAKVLKRIAGDSFKLLLTGTPIEKNIMDLYGLIWFIDETVLPDEREFLARYLRRPENYRSFPSASVNTASALCALRRKPTPRCRSECSSQMNTRHPCRSKDSTSCSMPT